MHSPDRRLVCTGCGHDAPLDQPWPFRCAAIKPEDGIDHVLTPAVDVLDLADAREWRGIFADPEPNPFVRYARLGLAAETFESTAGPGLAVEQHAALVRELDAAVAAADGTGHGFLETPFTLDQGLTEALDASGQLEIWVKNDTGNVSGSHKARHLFGIMVWLEAMRRAGRLPVEPGESAGAVAGSRPRLAIASCGNAALAAAVVARAAGYPLEVFIPPVASTMVVERLKALGAHLTHCPRRDGEAGDPCLHRFHEALATGAIPFAVQGSENGLTLDGGRTIAWEMVSALMRQRVGGLERVFVQVGGGALASSCVLGFHEATSARLLLRMPKIHAVQTEGGAPLRRAWERVIGDILDRHFEEEGGSRFRPEGDEERADFVRVHVRSELIQEVLLDAARHRARCMWPWETEPRSIAGGILDDETYDWFNIVRGMIESGGWPIVAEERLVRAANDLVRERTAIRADHTGTAGLAGLLAFTRGRVHREEERIAVLMTGAVRSAR